MGLKKKTIVLMIYHLKNDWRDDKNKTILGDKKAAQTENKKISKKDDFDLDFDDI